MASLIVNPSSYTITAINQNTITINYECDVTLTDVKLSTNGGSTFIDNTMMGTNVATFNVSNLVNNTYDCVLKGFYEEENTAPTEIPVQSITSSVNNSSLKVGETTQINTIFTPSNASNQTLTYRSDNTSIATVDEYGMITAIKEGTTQIVVSSNNNKTSTISINVIADSSGGAGGGTSSDITIAQSSYTIQAGQDIKVNYTSSKTLSTCMLLYGPDFSETDGYSGGYISASNEFTFYTSSKPTGTYTVKVKGRVWNDFTSSYDDYYSNIFTITIEDNTSGGETITPITIGNIDDITVKSGTTFDIVYTTNVEAVKHEMSLDGGYSYNTIYPNGDKNGYIYQHEALTESSSPYQRIIRVTDSNGYNATSNIINITVSSDNTGGGTEPSPSYDITISPTSYAVEAGQDVKVNYTSTVDLSTCILLYAPDYNENNYSGGYISAPGEFTFYTSSKPTGTYTVKAKGRRFNNSTSSYEDYYSNEFTIVITDPSTGGDTGGDTGGGDTGGDTSNAITIAQSSYTIQAGVDVKVNYTSSIALSTCMLLYAPDYSESDGYSGGYISNPNEFTFYTSSKAPGTYTVKVKGRKFNNSTNSYDDYYSNTFTLIIGGSSSGGSGGTTTPITISNIDNMTVASGSTFNITYTTSVDATRHEMSFDGGSTFNVIYPTGDKNGYSYQHEGITETAYSHQRIIRVRDANGNTATSNTFSITVSSGGSSGGGGGTTPIIISNISDMTVNKGSTFNIVYTTNVDAVRHEMSFDGGSSYNVIYPSGDKYGYTYQHEALTETSYPHQRKIRVTDANGNTATSNTFNITVSSGGSSGGGSGSTKSPFLASMYGDPRVIPNYPSGIQFPPINAHEDGIQPNGVNTTDSWKYGTRINLNPRNDWTRIGFWGQVYRQEGYGYDPDNVAVEIKDCKLWGWNGSSWVLIHDVSFTPYNTSFYVESFAGDSNKKFPSNVKINGNNATIKFDSVNSGYMFHPYSGKARANDYGLPQPYYYCSTMSARLVKWDSSGVDNLDSAKLCFNVGGDFWHTTHETWQPDWSANGEYAQGQFLKCTREWKTAYCTNVPESWGNGFPTFPVSAMEARAFNLGAKAVSTVISNRFTIIVNRNNESNVGPNNPPTTVAPVKVKENLRVAKVNYDSKLTNLKNTITSIINKTQITEADKTILNSAIDQYKTSVAELNKRFDESINNIIENKSNEAQNNATAYSKAELEILSDRIISKVSNEEFSSVIEQTNKDWTATFKDGYNEGSTTINRHGVTVRNGALRVKNNSGTTVLEGDSDGNLILNGKVINGYNGLSTSIDRGGVNFESTGEKVGYMRSASFNSNRTVNGVVIGNYTNGEFVDLGYCDKDFHTDNISYTPQIRLTKHTTELTGNFAGVQIKDNTRVDAGRKLFFKNDSAYDSEIYTSSTGHLNLYGDNGFNLGYKNGSSNVSAIQMDESSDAIFFKSNMRDYKNGTSYKVLSRFEHGSIEKHAPRIQNMNAYLDSGWYSFGPDCSGTPTSWGIMLTIRAFSNDFCQIVHGTNNVLYIRWYANGSYTSWKNW